MRSHTWVTEPVDPVHGIAQSLVNTALPQPGDAYLRFQVVDVLGRGGMGVVLLARDPELGRNVAIKLVKSENAHLQASLLREAKAMAQLRHANVVTVYEAGVDDEGRVYMVMEAGRATLRQQLNRHPLPWRELVDLFVGAGQGLAAAHRAGFVHRDFKPDNVFLGDDGSARVGDFGLVSGGGSAAAGKSLALQDTETFASDLMLGTPAYMPPEQYHGRPVDERGDQFSFCASLWEALYGELPFAGQTLDEYVAAVERGDLRPPRPHSPVPRWVRSVLARGLRADPNERYPDMQALLDEFARDTFARAPGLHFFGMLVGLYILVPLGALYTGHDWTGMLVVEGSLLFFTLLFGALMRELVARSSFNWIGYRLIVVALLALLLFYAGALIIGLEANHASVLNPIFLAIPALVGMCTMKGHLSLAAGLYLLTSFAQAIYPPAGPVVLAMANASLMLIAFVIWRPVYKTAVAEAGGEGVGAVVAGNRVGRFEVLRVLREEEEDSLVEAHDPRLRRRVTLQVGKVALRDARLLAALRHPNLITVYQVGIHEALPYVAYECVSGKTLGAELLARPDMDWREILRLFVAAGRGLSAGHRAGSVLGSFATDCVFLEQGGRVLVGGFGFRPPRSGPERHRAAPEVLRGREPTAASDQYAFCAALWHALYAPRTDQQKRKRDRRGLAVSGPLAGGTQSGAPKLSQRGAPAWISEILARGMRSRPERRYASMDELLAELEKSGQVGPARLQLRSLLAYAPLGLVPLVVSGMEIDSPSPFSHFQMILMAAGCLLYLFLVELALKAPSSVLRNRWTWWGLATCLGGSGTMAVSGLLADIPPALTEPLNLCIYATVAGAVTVSTEPRLWPSVLLFAAAFIASCVFPEHVYVIGAVTVLFCAANAAWVVPVQNEDTAPPATANKDT